MLAFEGAKREEEQTFHSMSLLKTLPSINSTRDTNPSRRKSSLGGSIRGSAFMAFNTELGPIVKRFAQTIPSEIIGITPNDPLMVVHAKNADIDTRLRFLKTENKHGEKVIEVERGSFWADTYPHLD